MKVGLSRARLLPPSLALSLSSIRQARPRRGFRRLAARLQLERLRWFCPGATVTDGSVRRTNADTEKSRLSRPARALLQRPLHPACWCEEGDEKAREIGVNVCWEGVGGALGSHARERERERERESWERGERDQRKRGRTRERGERERSIVYDAASVRRCQCNFQASYTAVIFVHWQHTGSVVHWQRRTLAALYTAVIFKLQPQQQLSAT